MDEDQLYVVTPPHSLPRRVPADTISAEWFAEKLDQIPTRKEMYRVALLATATGGLSADSSANRGRDPVPLICAGRMVRLYRQPVQLNPRCKKLRLGTRV
jgi:hypothetical protein